MNKQENELLLMMLSEMKDMKSMQEHQGQILQEHTEHFKYIEQRLEGMESKLDYVYNLALDNYGAIKEQEMSFKLLEGRVKAPRSRNARVVRKWEKGKRNKE